MLRQDGGTNKLNVSTGGGTAMRRLAAFPNAVEGLLWNYQANLVGQYEA